MKRKTSVADVAMKALTKQLKCKRCDGVGYVMYSPSGCGNCPDCNPDCTKPTKRHTFTDTERMDWIVDSAKVVLPRTNGKCVWTRREIDAAMRKAGKK